MRFKVENGNTKREIEDEIIRRKYFCDYYVVELHLDENKRFYEMVETFNTKECAINHVDYCKKEGLIF